MCIRCEMREKALQSLAFSPVSKPHTHITYMLRQCTSIVYLWFDIKYMYMTNKQIMILIFDRTYQIIKYELLVFNAPFNQQYFRNIIGVSFNSTHFIFTKYWLSSTISNRVHQTRRSGRNSCPISAEVALPRLQSEIKGN